jgi:glycosyltransferase involved in cell wall biosynthesis
VGDYSIKIAHIFNMANNGWHIVRALRQRGIEADLILQSKMFGMAMPLWEYIDETIDPFKLENDKRYLKSLLNKYDIPSWVKVWWVGSPKYNLLQVGQLIQDTKKYDLLHLHPFSPIYYSHFNKPFVVHEAGWIRTLANGMLPFEKMGRLSYANADCVLMTNPDTYPILNKMPHKKSEFIPFVIDPKQYAQFDVPINEDSPLFFQPSRQNWIIKGNHLLFFAFKKYLMSGGRGKLRCVSWGPDVFRSIKLTKRLGISERVEWVPPYTKPQLIRVYNESSIVFDQFVLGSGGTACYEAMSCGVPVAIYLNEWNKLCFGEMPPVINVRTVDEIANAMSYEYSRKEREIIKRKQLQFINKYNSPRVIAQKVQNLYEEILE